MGISGITEMPIPQYFYGSLQEHYVCRLGTTVAFNYIKLNALAFLEGLETFALNSGKVNKDIPAIGGFDKAIAFFGIEPFYCTLHLWASFSFITSKSGIILITFSSLLYPEA